MDNLLDDDALREYHFTDQDFEQIRQLIYKYAGINLSDAKKALVYSRVARRLRANEITRFDEYLKFLQQSGNSEEWEYFVNALTTNLTAFYREPHHFPILAEHVKTIKTRTPIKLWCSAASTGEEAYTMAMTMVEVFGSFTPPVKILATDLDTQVLKTAATGVYSQERVEKLSSEQLKRFFLRGSGNREGQVRVRPELQAMIEFRQLNLLDDSWGINDKFDAIFCRNVMIYFDKPTQRKILEKFIPVMHGDGLLFAGHSESFHHVADLFKLTGRTVYALVNDRIK